MQNRFVRSSKFRHVYGSSKKREQCYDNLNVSYDSNDCFLAQCNGKYLSVHWSAGGGGAFAVIPVEATGKLGTDIPLFEGHTAQVLATAFSPFNDDLIASAGEDGKILLWNIPQPGGPASELKPALTLPAHDRRIVDLKFNPVAENVLSSASHDQTVKVWDLEKATARAILTGHNDSVLDQSWNWTGGRLATSSRDKHLRIFDPRAEKSLIDEVKAHEGVKGVRVEWLGDSDRLLTTGFSKTSDRQFSIWDLRNLSGGPLKTENLDTSSGLLIPYYDADTKMLYLAGKGDGNIRFYELVDDAPYYHFISEYKSTEPQRAVSWLTKRAVNVSENEIARAYKVHNNLIEPISFRVPRKVESFQADLFPETPGPNPALTASQYWDEKSDAKPTLVSLEKGFAPSLRREFTVSLSGLDSTVGSQSASGLLSSVSDEDLKEELRKLKIENEALRSKVLELEANLKSL